MAIPTRAKHQAGVDVVGPTIVTITVVAKIQADTSMDLTIASLARKGAVAVTPVTTRGHVEENEHGRQNLNRRDRDRIKDGSEHVIK